eukprot:jgi/Chlat1/513/Chrsp103S01109
MAGAAAVAGAGVGRAMMVVPFSRGLAVGASLCSQHRGSRLTAGSGRGSAGLRGSTPACWRAASGQRRLPLCVSSSAQNNGNGVGVATATASASATTNSNDQQLFDCPVANVVVNYDPAILNNAVAGDGALCTGLKGINPLFGEYVVRAASDAFSKRLIPQKVKVFITIILDVLHATITGPGTPYVAHIDMAAKQGTCIEELEEILLLSCTLCGFNKAAGAFGKFAEMKAKEQTDFGTPLLWSTATATATATVPTPVASTTGRQYSWSTTKTSGANYENGMREDQTTLAALQSINSTYADFYMRTGADGWDGKLVPQKHKLFCAIAVDVSAGLVRGRGNPFELHCKLAAKTGATAAEIEEVLYQTCVYCGFNKAGYAFAAFEDLKPFLYS